MCCTLVSQLHTVFAGKQHAASLWVVLVTNFNNSTKLLTIIISICSSDLYGGGDMEYSRLNQLKSGKKVSSVDFAKVSLSF